MLQTTKTQVIILLGPPGAGKGSQAALIKEKLKLPHISTGDLLRSNIKQNAELGIKAKTYMDKGLLVPDNLIFDMLFQRVAESDCMKGYILDGFPRNTAQAERLKKELRSVEMIALNLSLKDSAIIDRITKREICKQCQIPYHPTFSPPKIKGQCDACSGVLYKRSDDTKEVVEERLKVYHEKTAPLIEYYKKEGILHTIDSSASKEVVLLKILNLIAP